MQEEKRPLNYAGLALAMIVGALGIFAVNLYSARDFVEAALLKRARAHFADAMVSERWLKHDHAAGESVAPAARSHEMHLIGINPRSDTHRPDAWEAEAMRAMVGDGLEYSARVRKDDTTRFRYMAPLYAEQRCLVCHAGQGYVEGQLVGGISIAFDATDTDQASRSNIVGTGIAVVLIMLGVGQVLVFSIRRVRELGRLTDSERARLKSLVQTMDGVVWEADPKTMQFSFVSRHAITLMGYPIEFWLQPGFWADHIHPDDREAAIERRQQDAGKVEPSEYEYRFMTRSGRVVWVHDRLSLVLTDGKPSALRGIMIDVTVRKQAEKEVGKLLRAVEQSPVSIIITNRDGVIEYVNPRFTQLFGYTRAEAVGKNPRFLKSGDTPSAVYDDLWQTIKAGKEWKGRLLNRCKDGSLIWEDASIVPLFSEKDEITHFLAVKEDVTDRLRVEKELAQYRDHLEDEVRARTRDLVLAMQKAKAADGAKSEFLTNMSHEIRTPLNAIIGFCELALRTDLNARQRDYLDKVNGASQHLLQLINNLLDLSKIAAGRIEISAVEFDLQHLMARIGSVLSYKATEKGLRFDIEVDRALPKRVLGDALRVNQVLLNLINNAIKFTEKGSIRVEVKPVLIDEQFIRVGFSVEDTGIGMDAVEMVRAFQPFAQGDASISRKYGGTGLGLSISRDLIGLMGGELETQSEKGRGSRFAFSLDFATVIVPETGVEAVAADTRTDEAYQFPGLRVLLVEDQPLNRQLAGEMLDAAGVVVEMCTNGREAVDCLFARGADAFDVVLMDLQMPEFDGLSAMKLIRAQAGFGALPMIAMTAHVLEEERRRAVAAGANGHLGKPFYSIDLYEVLARFAPPGKVRRIAPVGGAVPATDSPTAVDDGVIDWAAGLERFGGSEEKYRRWLQRFIDERTGVADEAAAMLDAGQAQEAAQLVHALKGVAGMLGLKQVFDVARRLEGECREVAAGRSPPVAAVDLDALRTAIAEARQAIAGLGEASPAPASGV